MELRTQVAAQQQEIAALAAFVDAQADALVLCKTALSELSGYLVNSSTIGWLREGPTQYDNMGKCTDALAKLDSTAELR